MRVTDRSKVIVLEAYPNPATHKDNWIATSNGYIFIACCYGDIYVNGVRVFNPQEDSIRHFVLIPVKKKDEISGFYGIDRRFIFVPCK